jgi:RNA polymerase sigma-70 factor (ECF subfamily)
VRSPRPSARRGIGGAGVAEGAAAEPLTPLVELQLLESHRAGDAEALGRLLAAYQHRIYSVCWRMVRNEPDARELSQEALVKVLQGLDGYDGRSRLSTWIVRVTMNCCLSHLRRQRLRRHEGIDGPAEPAAPVELAPPERVQHSEMRTALRQALLALDPDSRAMLVLRDLQELEYDRIAEVLEVPIGTVKSRLFRARLALRAAVEAELHGADGRAQRRAE